MGLIHTAVVLASSSSGDSESEFGLLAVPFVVAIGFWLLTYRRYRNQDARYSFEHTESQVTNIRRVDSKTGSRTRLRSKTLENRNERDAIAQIPIDSMGEDIPISR